MTPALRGVGCGRLARIIALIGVLLLFSAYAAQADDERALLERRVKAAFIFQFLNYVEWPQGTFSQANSPITIAVAGDDELAGELAQIAATRTVDGRPLRVRRAKGADAIADVHLLFVGHAEMAALPLWVRMAQSRPILIITEVAGALDQRSMINFQLIQNRLRFEVSLDEFEKHGLRVSSRLLAVAHTVRRISPQ